MGGILSFLIGKNITSTLNNFVMGTNIFSIGIMVKFVRARAFAFFELKVEKMTKNKLINYVNFKLIKRGGTRFMPHRFI